MHLLDVIYPKFCIGCGRFGSYLCTSCIQRMVLRSSNEMICPQCQRQAVRGYTHPRCKTKYSLDGLTSFFKYTGVVRKAIKTIKYKYASAIIPSVVSCISSEAPIHRLPTILIPVPLHTKRFRQRGFNQAELIAQSLSKQWSIPMKSHVLTRAVHTTPQVEMKDKEERLHNMHNAFVVTQKLLPKVHVLLVDDVYTTGATLRAACIALKRSGVRSVWGVTLAH